MQAAKKSKAPALSRNLAVSPEGWLVTTAVRKLRELSISGKRTLEVPGGTSAGKTVGIIPQLYQDAIEMPGATISVVAESVPHLKKGAIRDFKKFMVSTGRWRDKDYNKTDRVYNFRNGSYIEFFSAESEAKVRGPRRDILYINEANNLTFETYYQLAIRTNLKIWLDYNPTAEFWAHTELANDPDAAKLILTYKDNEALAPAIVKEIEKNRAKAFYDESLEGKALFAEANIKNSYWANWWKVYGLGQVGSLEGVIFDNWKQINGVPEGAKLLGYGQDFGFTNDPAATVAVYAWDGKIILDELIYQKGLLNSDLAAMYRQVGVKPGVVIYADQAEPKSIKELVSYGFNVLPAGKGKDSVNFGIDLLQGYEMLVTSRSLNLIKELRTYSWAKDKKTGKATNKPVDAFNHAIDAARYLAVMLLTNYTPNYKSRSHGKTKRKSKGSHYQDFLD
jgi:phage terminase large subunit